MADVIPFCGTTYNLNAVGDLTDVVTPPFDVISPRDQAFFYRRHPYNIIRIILGEQRPTDSDTDNRYLRAAAFFKQWRAEGVLVEDAGPAFYLSAVDYAQGAGTITRFGIIATVGIEPFERGIILPHEHTFSKVKSERLELLRACPANFSPIFALFSHDNDILAPMKEKAADQAPDFTFSDHVGLRRRLWRIGDASLCADFTAAMASKALVIADGHHRYETALNYRQWRAARDPGYRPDQRCNFVMMYLCQMEDPNVAILPAHRLVNGLADRQLDELVTKAADHFDITAVDEPPETFMQRLAGCQPRTAFGLRLRNRPALHLMVLKPETMDRFFADELHPALRAIDAAVLTHLVLMRLLGMDKLQLDDEKRIEYTSNPAEAIERVASGANDAAFLLNPTRIDQVGQVARAGLVMPRKATYFYPKVMEGEVIHCL